MRGLKRPQFQPMTLDAKTQFSASQYERLKADVSNHSISKSREKLKDAKFSDDLQRLLTEFAMVIDVKDAPKKARSEFTELLLSFLSETNNEVFDTASLLLTNIRDDEIPSKEVVAHLKKCLNAKAETEFEIVTISSADGHTPVVRASAARALSMMGISGALSDIKKLIKDPNDVVRRYATNAVAELEAFISRIN